MDSKLKLLVSVSFVFSFLALSQSVLAEPLFTNNATSVNTTSVANAMTFNSTENVSFQMTVTDVSGNAPNITNVTFQVGRPDNTFFNYTANYSAIGASLTVPAIQNSSSTGFFINFTQSMFGSAGTYNFTWMARNSTGGENRSATVTFVLSKAALDRFLRVSINGVLNTSTTIQYPSGSTVFGSFNNSMASDVTFALFRNDTDVTAAQNNTGLVLTATTYNITYGTANATVANYTVANASYLNLTVNKGTLTNFTDISINGTFNTTTVITYTGTAAVVGRFNSTGAFDVGFSLYQNGTNVTSIQNNTAFLNGVGNFSYTYGSSAATAANWTLGNSTGTILTVNKGTLTNFTDISVNGNFNTSATIIYPSGTTVFGRFNSTGASDTTFALFRNGTDVTTAQNNTGLVLGATTYNLTYGTATASPANWTAGNTSVNLTVNRGTLTNFTDISVNGAFTTNSSNVTITYPYGTTIFGRFNSTGAGDFTFGLFRNGTNVTVAQNNTGLVLGATTYTFSYGTNFATPENWTVGNSSTVFLTVNKGTLTNFTGLSVNGVYNASSTTINYPFGATVSGRSFNSTGADDITFDLYRNETNATFQNNTNFVLGATSHVFTYGTNTASPANWTAQNNTNLTLIVNKGTLTNFTDISINGTFNTTTVITYTGTAAVVGRFNSTGAFDVGFSLYQNGTNVTSIQNNTAFLNGVGNFSYTYGSSAATAANWTLGNSTGTILTVNKGTLTNFTDVRIDAGAYNTTVSQKYPVDFNNISARFNSTGADDITFTLFVNGANQTLQNNTFVNRTAGNYTIVYGANSATASNWTVANTSAIAINISKGSQIATIFLDGVTTNKAYEKGSAVNITARTNATNNLTSSLNIFTNFTTGANASIAYSSGSYSALYNSTNTSFMPLRNYTVSANVSETENYTTVSNDTLFIILIDTTSPAINNLKLSPAATTVSNPVTITAGFSDLDGVTLGNITVVKPSGSNPTSVANFNGTYTYTDTNTAGTYSVTLRASDPSGNSVSLSSSFSVSAAGGSSGGSSSSSTATSTATSTKETKTVNVGSEGATVAMTKGADHGVVDIVISVNSPANSVQVSVQKLDGKPAAVTQDVAGTVYRYLDISASGLSDANVKSAKIKFSIDASWLTQNGADKDNVALNRYHNDVWTALETRYVSTSSDGKTLTFEADTPGFSTYAITAEAAPETTAAPSAETTPAQPSEPVETTAAPAAQPAYGYDMNVVWAVVGIVVVVGVVAFAMKTRGKKTKK